MAGSQYFNQDRTGGIKEIRCCVRAEGLSAFGGLEEDASRLEEGPAANGGRKREDQKLRRSEG